MQFSLHEMAVHQVLGLHYLGFGLHYLSSRLGVSLHILSKNGDLV
jgi:hypothetical protein